jgi:hypothetical protein
MKERQFKFYKSMAVSAVTYGSCIWIITKKKEEGRMKERKP